MTFYGFSSTFKERSDSFHIPYICAFSPMLRAAVVAMNKHDAVATQIEGIVEEIDSTEEVAKSLKAGCNGVLGERAIRQVDLRPAPNHPLVLLKCFVGWDGDNQKWLVWAEGGTETYWEDRGGPVIGNG